MGDMFDEVVIVSDSGCKFDIAGVTEVRDIYPCRGPLGGVHAGLTAVRNQWIFVAACDMPSIENFSFRGFSMRFPATAE